MVHVINNSLLERETKLLRDKNSSSKVSTLHFHAATYLSNFILAEIETTYN